MSSLQLHPELKNNYRFFNITYKHIHTKSNIDTSEAKVIAYINKCKHTAVKYQIIHTYTSNITINDNDSAIVIDDSLSKRINRIVVDINNKIRNDHNNAINALANQNKKQQLIIKQLLLLRKLPWR